MSYLVLIAGIVMLLGFGDLLVRGAVGLAERLGIPPVIIGLTVVAFGTSAPELVVSLKAAMAEAPSIAIGNVIGSNVANILLVLGIPAIVAKISTDEPYVLRNCYYVLAVSVIFIALCFLGPLSWWHGAILLVLMALFLTESAQRASEGRNGNKTVTLEDIENIDGVTMVPHNPWLTVFFVAAGLIGLPVGGHLTVDAAKTIAVDWGVSEAVIGLTVVALGTSLPELATSLVAACRNHTGIAVGNVLGSNLFNILAIMGITAVVIPVHVEEHFLKFDLWVMLAAMAAVMPYVMLRRDIARYSGIAFVAAYAAYVYVLIASNGTALATVH